MKNSKKLIGLATALLAIGSLAACGGAKGSDSKAPAGSSKCSHKWVVDEEKSVAATCTTEGKKVQKCSVCGEVKESKVSKKAHSYVEQAGGTAATCEAAGTKISKCSVCEDVKTEEVPALGHDYVDDADQPNAATCIAAGETVQHCSRCQAEHKVAVEALGHDYADDDDQTGAKQPTCTAAGEKFQTCTRCGDKHSEPVEALGHDVQLIGDDTEPEPGYAKVRTYTCANGCGDTYLGFKASEVTDESKATLKIGEDGGARFFGHPIGNDLELDEDGAAANRGDTVPVYSKEQKGDFFEYKFKLTDAQAAALQNCELYCDAKPSDYMGANGVDFWKVKGDAASDWTYGMYIDDAPEHQPTLNEDGTYTGVIVEDFRYVLYVDDVLQTMDSTRDTPVKRGDPRGEYVLPFTFKLHSGENKIRLVMAGGYRSTFYNFTFRAVEAPVDPDPGTDPNPGTDPAVKEPIQTWNFADLEKVGSPSAKSGKLTADAAESTSLYKISSEGSGIQVKYTSDAAKKVTLRVWFATKGVNIEKTNVYYQMEGETEANKPTKKYTVKVGDVEQALPEAREAEKHITCADAGMVNENLTLISDNGNVCQPVWFDFCELNLAAGENVISLTKASAAGYSCYFGALAII